MQQCLNYSKYFSQAKNRFRQCVITMGGKLNTCWAKDDSLLDLTGKEYICKNKHLG